MSRHTRENPCPVCGGHPWMQRGRAERCWGRTSQDERGQVWTICTREEHRGKLNMRSTGYPHLLKAVCDCNEKGRNPSRCKCEVCGCGVVHSTGDMPVRMPSSPQDQKQDEANLRSAQRIWRESRSPQGTAVERYLRTRGIALPVPERLRFNASLRYPDKTRWPGMVALVTDSQDRPIAIHRTFLARDGSGKAPVEEAKMALGPIGGGAVRLAPAAERILVAEGIETTLAAMELSRLPGWAAISAGGIERLELPRSVRSILIAADRDETSGIGVAAARAAAQRWIAEGRHVEIVQPHAPHGDYADVLLASKATGSAQGAGR